MGKTSLAELPDVCSPKDLASALGVGYAKALHIIKHGGLVHIKAGNHFLVSKTKFIEWLNAGTTRFIDTE